MSQFKKFRDFAEEKGFANKNGLIPNQDIPPTKKLPKLLDLDTKSGSLGGRDYHGQMMPNPVKGTPEKPLPYKGYNTMDNDKTGRGVLVNDDGNKDKPFGDYGNKILTPQNSAPYGKTPEKDIELVKHKKGKMTSEEFINETKDMSPAEFLSFFVEGNDEPLPTVTDLYGNEFTPDPNQTIQYMAALMVKNPRLMSRFMREMKRHDTGMNQMMGESFNHPEFYSVLAEGMAEPEEGRKRCHRISRAMNDQYMDALGKFVIEQNLNEEVVPRNELDYEEGGPAIGKPPENPSGMGTATPQMKPQQQGGSFGGGGGPQVNEPLPPGLSGGGGGGDAAGGGTAGVGDVPGGGGMPGGGAGATPAGMGGLGGGPSPTPPSGPGGTGFDGGTGQPQKKEPQLKMKSETAHGNMIEEMGGFPHMFKAMADHCINCKK